MKNRRNNFGNWLNFKLDNLGKTKTWLENRSNLSTGSICRWIKGSTPGIDNYFSVCSTLAKEMHVDVSEVVKETLNYMPYLGQYLHLQKNPRPRQ